MAERKFHFSIEGNIAVGKSTFLHNLQQEIEKQNLALKIDIFQEPVLHWQSFGNKHTNLLEKMYLDPVQNSFLFQTVAMSTKVRQLQFTKSINVVERSLHSQQKIFIPLLREKEALTELQVEVLNYCINTHLMDVELIPDHYLYLTLDPVNVEKRLRIRSRDEEHVVDLAYLAKVQEKHEQWLRTKPEVTVFDTSQPIDSGQVLRQLVTLAQK